MKKATAFYEEERWKLTELLNSWSSRYKWGVTFVGASDIERFLLFYHNVLLDHLVKEFEMLKINYTNDDPESSRESYCRGFNQALDRVREKMEGEKV